MNISTCRLISLIGLPFVFCLGLLVEPFQDWIFFDWFMVGLFSITLIQWIFEKIKK